MLIQTKLKYHFRIDSQGSVLSFVDMKEKVLMDAVENHLKTGFSTEDDVLKWVYINQNVYHSTKIPNFNVLLKSHFRNYQFKLEEVEAFRYRAKDAWRSITRVAVRDARIKEIKDQVFNCEKLKVKIVYLFPKQKRSSILNIIFLTLSPQSLIPELLRRESTWHAGSAARQTDRHRQETGPSVRCARVHCAGRTQAACRHLDASQEQATASERIQIQVDLCHAPNESVTGGQSGLCEKEATIGGGSPVNKKHYLVICIWIWFIIFICLFRYRWIDWSTSRVNN